MKIHVESEAMMVLIKTLDTSWSPELRTCERLSA